MVLTTILSGSTEVWRYDIEIPKKYGVDINVGDTRGPSGIFRFLRTLPDMMEIVRDMEKYCPNAVLLNYTNPMAMLCAAIQRQTFIPVTGLCHSVQGTAMMLAEWIGAPYEEITYTCAGINHMAWYLDYKWNGKDAYPLIHKAVTEPAGLRFGVLETGEGLLTLEVEPVVVADDDGVSERRCAGLGKCREPAGEQHDDDD